MLLLVNKMENNIKDAYNYTLLNNFIEYCKNKIDDSNFIKLFSKMLIYDDYLIYKDVLSDVLNIKLDKINYVAKNNNYETIKFDYDKLPEKAIYIDKKRIRPNTNIWFVNRKNLLKIIILFRSDKNLTIVNYLLDLEDLLIKFLKEYGNTYMIEKKYLTDEIKAHIIKIQHIQNNLDERVAAFKNVKITRQKDKLSVMRAKDKLTDVLDDIYPESCNSSLLDGYNSDEHDHLRPHDEEYYEDRELRKQDLEELGEKNIEICGKKKSIRKDIDSIEIIKDEKVKGINEYFDI